MFTLKASRSCSFIMRHVDVRGKVQQICPNEYAPNVNNLTANQPLIVPGTTMPFEFAASEPPGIEAIRLIVSPRELAYNPSMDKVDIDSKTDLEQTVAMSSTTRGGYRGLKLQPKNDPISAGSAGMAVYQDNAAGNAVVVETFIRVLPLRR